MRVEMERINPSAEAAARRGTVYLVGAGPGDPGLLTVRARDLLASCEVVVYDHLINPEILLIAPAGAEQIYAGKIGCGQQTAQEEINRLLVARARLGRRVVRLKGGDPFLFGRGSEEAAALREAGLPFEVVPGVSSALAAPAYAGIPLTHRGLAASVAILTGAHVGGRFDTRALAALSSMGIAAAGNSSTVITNLLAPRLADLVGWHNVLGLAMLPLAVVLAVFVLLARDSPSQGKGLPAASYLTALRQADLWWFCLLYSVTFGGYVGLSSFLPIFFRDQYQVSPVTAGYLTALAAFVGSGLRPFGGYLADRVGGVRLLSFLLGGIAAIYALGGWMPALGPMVALLVCGMACLGMANGAVFQLVPRRFEGQVGLATGVVGAVGGVGGFLLPTLLSQVKQAGGSFGPGFFALAVVAAGAAVSLYVLAAAQQGWRLSWHTSSPAEALEEV